MSTTFLNNHVSIYTAAKKFFILLLLILCCYFKSTAQFRFDDDFYDSFYIGPLQNLQLCSPQSVQLTAGFEFPYSTSMLSGELRWYTSATATSYVYNESVNNANGKSYNYYSYYDVSSNYNVQAVDGKTIWVSFYSYNLNQESRRISYTFHFGTPIRVDVGYARVCDDGIGRVQLVTNASSATFDLINPYGELMRNTTGYFEIPNFDKAHPYGYTFKMATNVGCGFSSYNSYDINFDIPANFAPPSVWANGRQISPYIEICKGSEKTIDAGGNYDQYNWYDANNKLICQACTDFTIENTRPLGYYYYTLKGVSEQGCLSNPQGVIVAVTGPPQPGEIYTSTPTIQLGDPVTIESDYGYGTPVYWCSSNGRQSWNVFNEQYKGENYFDHIPESVGTYRYEVYNQTACGYCWDPKGGGCSEPVYVEVNVIPRKDAKDADNQNYVRVRTPMVPVDYAYWDQLGSIKTATQYYDGLGRVTQSVVKEGSKITGDGTAYDVVSPAYYDEFGRQSKAYMPYVCPISTGRAKDVPFDQQKTFYDAYLSGQGETYYYSQTNFESSPLNRVQKTMAPGNNFVGADRGNQINYLFNTANDNIKIWKVTDAATIGDLATYSISGSYEANKLNKTVTTDENGKQLVQFTDAEGKLILKKVQLTAANDNEGYSGWLCTYYVYDNFNQLRALLTPKLVEYLASNSWPALTETLLGELAFRYEYDDRHRAIVKQTPGAAPVYTVYDGKDRPVLYRDGNLAGSQQWLYTTYDMYDRPVSTGVWNNSQSFSQHYTAALDNTTGYPNLGGQTYDEYSRTFYDNYDWLDTYTGTGFSKSMSASGSEFYGASDNSYPYAQALAQNNAIKGSVTGTRVKVLEQSKYLYTITYYDSKGRTIQVQSQNITGGIDIATTQYSFNGAVLVSRTQHQKAGTNAQTHDSWTRYTYDDLWRVTKTEKKINSTIPKTNGTANNTFTKGWVTIAELEYDALGQVVKKKIGRKQDANKNYTNEPIETQTFDYNISGNLLGVNRAYLKDNTPALSGNFGMELAYDKTTSQSSSLTYGKAQYNGDIAGFMWKGVNDGVRRVYNYDYDNAGQLTQAAFKQNESGSAWDNSKIDFSASNTYDANGNIKTMTQRGWKPGGPIDLDKLTYTYNSTNQLSNKLLAVNEANPVNYGMSDFTDNNTALNDYTYDANGNMLTDKNKRISSITYNYLNLPQTITVLKEDGSVKGTITYVYDAAGTRLQKTVSPNGSAAVTTTYAGGAEYKNDVLQHLAFEEGMVRFDKACNTIYPAQEDGLFFDYFIRDHLGNTRVVLTEQKEINQFEKLSLEDAALQNQNNFWEDGSGLPVNVSTIREAWPSAVKNNGAYNTTKYGNYGIKLSKTGRTLGAAKLLKVMAGDQVNAAVDYWYDVASQDARQSNGTNTIISSLMGLLGGIGAEALKGSASQITSALQGSDAFTGVLAAQNPGTASEAPKAYLNILFFDEQFNFDNTNSICQKVDADAPGQLKPIVKSLQAAKSGYVYVSITNESTGNVYFDNFMLSLDHGPLLATHNYYPYGQQITPIGSTALGRSDWFKNNYTYQADNSEYEDDLGLNLQAFELRNYDPQTGRWIQQDPYDEFASGYVGMGNKPTKNVDPNGGCIWCETADKAMTLQEVVVTPHSNYLANLVNTAKTISVAFTTSFNYLYSFKNASESLRKGMVSSTGVLNGALNTASFGTWPTRPLIPSGYTPEDMEIYNKGVYIGQLGGLPMPGAGTRINPQMELAPVNGSSIPVGGVSAPFVKPFVPNDKVFSLDGSENDVANSSGNKTSQRVTSLVKSDSKLLKLAQETFHGNNLLRKEANSLLEQLNKGNMNPGIGSKNIGKNVFEARSRGGARVYFRNGSNGVEVLGYSNKINQQQVINRILEIY